MPNLGFQEGAEVTSIDAAGSLTRSVSNALPPRVTPIVDPASESGTTGQVPLTDASAIIRFPNPCRRALKITNIGTTDVWVGFGPSVTPTSGDLLVGVRGAFIIIPSTLSVYGICSSGQTATVSYLEISQ